MRLLFGSLMAFLFGFPGCFKSASPLTPPPAPPRAPSMVACAGPRIGQPAPEIVGDDLDGVPFRLSEYRGKVVVLDFWGHW
jgi:hypothetical protein